MIEIFNGSVYNFGSVSSIWATISYEKKRSGADMQYRFNYKIRLSNRSGGTPSSAYYQNNVQCKLYLNNINVWSKSVKSSSTNWSFEYISEWLTVDDKVDGTVPFKFTIKDTQNSSSCNYTSAVYQLDIEPAGSDFKTLPNFNIGQPFTITIDKYNEDLYDKLVIKLGETTIKTLNNIETPLLIEFTETELNTIYGLTANVPNVDFTFEISSYEDIEMNTQIGITNSKTAKGYIIASNPLISSISIVDINGDTIALTGNNTKIMRGYSNMQAIINAIGQNQATITSITVNNQVATNGVITFEKATTNVFNIVITDSRGFQTTDSITLEMINYIELTMSATVSRNQPTDGKVKINYSGNYFNGSFGSESNTLITQYRFKENGQEFTENDVWHNMTPTINNNTYQEVDFIVDGVDYQKIYSFQIRAKDKLNEWLITNMPIAKGDPVANWGDDYFNVNGDFTIKRHNVFDLIYPVGSIYISTLDTNPQTIYGGEWERIKDVFLLACGEEFTAGTTGGEKTVTLTVEQMPSHNHIERGSPANNSGYSDMILRGKAYSGGVSGHSTENTGGDQPHNNMPPYLAVYVWKRIS